MSAAEIDFMASHVALLSTSFEKVPPAAIPAMLDCILASTGISPMSLFSTLLDAFPNIKKDILKEDGRLDSGKCNYIGSFVSSLCHLLKKLGDTDDALKSYIWRCFIPLMKMVYAYDYELLNQLADLLFDVVIETKTWDVLEATLVPFFLRLVGHSMGMPQNDELTIYEWNRHSVFHGLDNQPNDVEKDRESELAESWSFPLRISCHILASILDAALRDHQATSTSESALANGGCYAEIIAGNLLWDLCNMTPLLLSQTLDHRSCAIGFLLPYIFKAFIPQHSFKISNHGKNYILSRKLFFVRMWMCCKTLFSLGTLERRDAYTVLSLYLSFFACIEEHEDTDITDRTEEFDIRAENEFWDEIRRGLVDKEGLVRKQSLHILKMTLHINGQSQSNSAVSEKILHEKISIPLGMTKRGVWADKEAHSLGVGNVSNSIAPCLNSQQRWEAFILLYEMLEEYGTHLVEAAWNHQINLLLHSSSSNEYSVSSKSRRANQNQMETLGDIFNWLPILWERGFHHDNPQVRCLIMQSFLEIEWNNHEKFAKSVPETFVLGPFIQGLNDHVYHQDFGVKGVYSSKTIEGATRFLRQFTRHLNVRKHISFLSNLASAAKQLSFGRVGLMSLAECIASAACGVQIFNGREAEWHEDAFHDISQLISPKESLLHNSKTDLLDVLRFVIESSKQHFNRNYRLQVCQKILEAAASVVCTFDVPLEILLLFISALPRDFTDCGGPLRGEVQKWLLGCGKKHCSANCCCDKMKLKNNLYDFPVRFISQQGLLTATINYDDEDLDAWEFNSKRWARVFFLVMEEDQLQPLLMFIQNHGTNICQQNSQLEWVPVRFLILILSLVQELQILQEKTAGHVMKVGRKSESGSHQGVNLLGSAEADIIFEKFVDSFLLILEELVSFSKYSCSILWSSTSTLTEVTTLPCSIRGRLGGRSQRRLSSTTTTAVLQAITSMKAIASMSSWCSQFKGYASLKFPFTFLWRFFWKIVLSSTCDSETGAEVRVAAYEALSFVLKPLVSAFSPLALDLIRNDDNFSLPKAEGQPVLDSMVLTFVQNINNLLAVGVLARSRRAVLMNWKWLCLESLLSIPYYVVENGVHIQNSFFSDAALRKIFCDLVQSLENAGEGSVLPMLKSVKLAMGIFASGRLGSVVSSHDGVDSQVMWELVHSSWILHVNCNKRRVAPIAALLSSVLHSSVFPDVSLHVINDEPGPLKWLIAKVLEEGTKSPRTIRLAALHLTGLWLLNPKTIKYYMKELKLLSLYGSVAFDEDFEAEIAENPDAKKEVSSLAKSPDPELTEAYLNMELYARVSVAVLFSKLADMADVVGSEKEDENCRAALESGKLFLLELLDSAVNDKDLSKELYKKYSAIHRRKVRIWQMICVLSRFIDQDIVQEVSRSLQICLYRNNLPAVRQYLETFTIHIYLKFPSLVGQQLVSILRDYDMKPQALSSYVFIAANVILHATEDVQSQHLDVLLPPVVPLLTSHHHSLRAFTQLLVYQLLCKLFPLLDNSDSEIMPLEKRCFEDLRSYLAKNSDCVRLRASMEGYLDAFDPKKSVTPSGIFTNRVEELEFECVPTSLLEQVLTFLNDVRDDLRSLMAKDAVTIRNESLKAHEHPNRMEISVDSSNGLMSTRLPKDVSFDFQKKITLSKHEAQGIDFSSFVHNKEIYKPFAEIENEDLLLDQLLQSRSLAMERLRAGRQQIFVVASLLDRIPNLAGLARTCEVFKAAGLAIADTSILQDKQFQLISVTAEKWVPIIEVPVNSVKVFLEKKKREGFSILGLEQTANSYPLDQYVFPKKMVLVLGREKEGIPVDIIHILDACIEIPQLGVVRSLNVHVSGAIALWEYTRQQRSQ